MSYINRCGSKVGVLWKKLVNTKAADTLAPGFSRPSAGMVLNLMDDGPMSSTAKDFKYQRYIFFEKW